MLSRLDNALAGSCLDNAGSESLLLAGNEAIQCAEVGILLMASVDPFTLRQNLG